MKKSFVYDLENLKKIQEIIGDYSPKEVPDMTAQINHIKEEGKARIRLTIEGNEKDVKKLY